MAGFEIAKETSVQEIKNDVGDLNNGVLEIQDQIENVYSAVNNGSIKSIQELLVHADLGLSSNTTNTSVKDEYGIYKDFQISPVNKSRTIVMVSSSIQFSSTSSAYFYSPLARLINSNTVRVYLTSSLYSNRITKYSSDMYVQIIEYM